MTGSRRLFVAMVAATILALLTPPGVASALERNFAGSAQIDYHAVPSQPHADAHSSGFDGFTAEVAMKVAVDVSDKLSANLKICYGCHGFEADMAYFDYRVADELNFRAGRFSPSFGNFNIRHDPANHRFSDKPLPYDMGRMLRLREWNLGVLPSPFPDNGIEINGTHWFGDSVQVDYAAYAISGFKGDKSSVDLDFQQSRTSYYVDNNGRPAVGGRGAVTLKLGDSSDATLGASGMYGTFDPDNSLSYAIFGADFSLRLDRTNIRMEYLGRRQRFDVSDPTRFKYVVAGKNGDFFTKHGAYVEIEQPVSSRVDLLARADGLYREGNVLMTSALDKKASVLRFSLGTAISIERGFRVKLSTELWQFSDRDANDRKVDLGLHAAAVGTY